MPHKEIGIVVAMRREVALLLGGTRAQQGDGIEFYELENVVVAVAGIGRKAASRAAEALTARYSPAMLVSAGIAGALTPQLKVGDVLRAYEVVDAESGTRFVSQGGEGTVVTVSSVSGEAEKRTLAERWNADVVDMEASAVATVAQRSGIEFAAIKAISDELDFEMPPLNEFVNEAGKFETLRFAMFLAIRPKWWGAVRRLSANSRVAAMNLSHELGHLTRSTPQVTREAKIIGA
jgi:adenosylhomocysteine nucleosidase